MAYNGSVLLFEHREGLAAEVQEKGFVSEYYCLTWLTSQGFVRGSVRMF